MNNQTEIHVESPVIRSKGKSLVLNLCAAVALSTGALALSMPGGEAVADASSVALEKDGYRIRSLSLAEAGEALDLRVQLRKAVRSTTNMIKGSHLHINVETSASGDVPEQIAELSWRDRTYTTRLQGDPAEIEGVSVAHHRDHAAGDHMS